MLYRPEYHLDELRMMRSFGTVVSSSQDDELPLLHFRWLRTMNVDCRRAPKERSEEALDRLSLQQRSAVGVAVERIVCKHVRKDHLSCLLRFVTRFVPRLTFLDLRVCHESVLNDACLLAVADAHRLSLRRLYLPPHRGISQSTLDHFTQLEELDITQCTTVTSVDFCSATLRVLFANECLGLTDAGLSNATRLEVLHVACCSNVTHVSPFAHRLLSLDISERPFWSCGIGSGVLWNCYRLQVLCAVDNLKITTLGPFVQRLRELHTGTNNALNDAALLDATGLVKLSASGNKGMTSVEPFRASLRELDASNSRIDDAGLGWTTNLVCLDASFTTLIRSVAPFSSTLLELRATGRCSIDLVALSAATKLICLDLSINRRLTSVQGCGQTLRHVVAQGMDCALTNEGLSSATQLVTLNCAWNPNLTTIEPFRHSLEELCADCDAQYLEVEGARNVHHIRGRHFGVRLTHRLEELGFWCTAKTGMFSLLHRPTVHYEVALPSLEAVITRR